MKHKQWYTKFCPSCKKEYHTTKPYAGKTRCEDCMGLNEIRTCPLCLKKFKPGSYNQVFCDLSCQSRSKSLRRRTEIIKMTDEEKKLRQRIKEYYGEA